MKKLLLTLTILSSGLAVVATTACGLENRTTKKVAPTTPSVLAPVNEYAKYNHEFTRKLTHKQIEGASTKQLVAAGYIKLDISEGKAFKYTAEELLKRLISRTIINTIVLKNRFLHEKKYVGYETLKALVMSINQSIDELAFVVIDPKHPGIRGIVDFKNQYFNLKDINIDLKESTLSGFFSKLKILTEGGQNMVLARILASADKSYLKDIALYLMNPKTDINLREVTRLVETREVVKEFASYGDLYVMDTTEHPTTHAIKILSPGKCWDDYFLLHGAKFAKELKHSPLLASVHGEFYKHIAFMNMADKSPVIFGTTMAKQLVLPVVSTKGAEVSGAEAYSIVKEYFLKPYLDSGKLAVEAIMQMDAFIEAEGISGTNDIISSANLVIELVTKVSAYSHSDFIDSNNEDLLKVISESGLIPLMLESLKFSDWSEAARLAFISKINIMFKLKDKPGDLLFINSAKKVTSHRMISAGIVINPTTKQQVLKEALKILREYLKK